MLNYQRIEQILSNHNIDILHIDEIVKKVPSVNEDYLDNWYRSYQFPDNGKKRVFEFPEEKIEQLIAIASFAVRSPELTPDVPDYSELYLCMDDSTRGFGLSAYVLTRYLEIPKIVQDLIAGHDVQKNIQYLAEFEKTNKHNIQQILLAHGFPDEIYQQYMNFKNEYIQKSSLTLRMN